MHTSTYVKNLLTNNETIENKVSGPVYDFGTVFYPGFKSFRIGISIKISLRDLNINRMLHSLNNMIYNKC